MDMHALPISVDQNNFIRGVPYHDARIETIAIKIGSCAIVTYVTTDNKKFQIHLERYKKLFLEEISDGFIIDDISLFYIDQIDNIQDFDRVVSLTELKVDTLKSLLLHKDQPDKYKNCKILYISNSYIGEIIAICEDVSLFSIT